ncbi:MAG: peptide chain release factor aRF-1 [Nanoarchaeota archaeon]|nr:peptide chain release factor aRF-1 [Nanoarchaeota archaeon]
MSITAKQKFKLRKLVEDLEKFRGRHTELVSVFIPAGYDMNKIINHLSQEQGTAENIKSTGTRKNVIAALERMIQHLKLFKQTPEHGLAAFSGNVAEREGQSDVQVWSIEPPVPLNIRIYRCDKEFVLDPLREMMEIKEVYGLVVMDRREANVAYLKGKTIIPLVKTHSMVPGKFKAGGQSAKRFAQNRELSAKDFYHKVADHMKDQFFENKDLKGIIVGGPGPTKYEFVDGNFITTELKKKIIGIKDITYTDEFGLNELLEKSSDLLAAEEVIKEKELMGKFFEKLAKEPGKAAYGEKEVMNALKIGAVDTLLISEKIPNDKLSEFEKEAEALGTTLEIISTETREGAQLMALGGFAAILRYSFDY